MKKNPSWERSKNASRSSGVLSWVGSGKAVGIASPEPERCGGCLFRGSRTRHPRAVLVRAGPRGWRDGLWLPVDEIVHRDEVGGAARAQIGAGRAQGGVAARDQHPGDDRRIEHRSEERKALDAALGGGCDVGDADAVRVEILDAR